MSTSSAPTEPKDARRTATSDVIRKQAVQTALKTGEPDHAATDAPTSPRSCVRPWHTTNHITADATDRARAMVVEELGHGFAQHVASRPPRSLIGVLRSSYRTNKLDNLLWKGHGS